MHTTSSTPSHHVIVETNALYYLHRCGLGLVVTVRDGVTVAAWIWMGRDAWSAQVGSV